jgi:hypothetical protein
MAIQVYDSTVSPHANDTCFSFKTLGKVLGHPVRHGVHEHAHDIRGGHHGHSRDNYERTCSQEDDSIHQVSAFRLGRTTAKSGCGKDCGLKFKQAKSQCNHFKKQRQNEQYGECMEKARAERKVCKANCPKSGGERSMGSFFNLIPLSMINRRQLYLAFI